jgi:hypothetical protein
MRRGFKSTCRGITICHYRREAGDIIHHVVPLIIIISSILSRYFGPCPHNSRFRPHLWSGSSHLHLRSIACFGTFLLFAHSVCVSSISSLRDFLVYLQFHDLASFRFRNISKVLYREYARHRSRDVDPVYYVMSILILCFFYRSNPLLLRIHFQSMLDHMPHFISTENKLEYIVEIAQDRGTHFNLQLNRHTPHSFFLDFVVQQVRS